MKKLGLVFLFSLLSVSLSGCIFNRGGKSGDNSGNSSSTPASDPSSQEDEKKQTYYFYIDFWHSDEPMYTMKWYQGQPLGSCPSECQLTDADATDPAFPTFLGWSDVSSAIDEEQLWDFANDSKLSTTVNLYGIWVSA